MAVCCLVTPVLLTLCLRARRTSWMEVPLKLTLTPNLTRGLDRRRRRRQGGHAQRRTEGRLGIEALRRGTETEIVDVVVVLQDPTLDGDQMTYTIDILDGDIPASGGANSLFIDTIGRPLSPVSVAGVHRRSRR